MRSPNRIEAVVRESLARFPRHIGSGGVRLEEQPIDLPAFAGQRWGSISRTSLRE